MPEEENEEWKKLPPVEVVLMCPRCGKQHLDIGEFATRVHRKHLCENTPEGEKTGCGHLWVPFQYPTKGVLSGPMTLSAHPHLIGGEFQSDKYPTCPRGKVPLSCKDPTAQDLLWEYAQRRRPVDPEFATDLELALRHAGYVHKPKILDDLRRVAAAGESVLLSKEDVRDLVQILAQRRA